MSNGGVCRTARATPGLLKNKKGHTDIIVCLTMAEVTMHKILDLFLLVQDALVFRAEEHLELLSHHTKYCKYQHNKVVTPIV